MKRNRKTYHCPNCLYRFKNFRWSYCDTYELCAKCPNCGIHAHSWTKTLDRLKEAKP